MKRSDETIPCQKSRIWSNFRKWVKKKNNNNDDDDVTKLLQMGASFPTWKASPPSLSLSLDRQQSEQKPFPKNVRHLCKLKMKINAILEKLLSPLASTNTKDYSFLKNWALLGLFFFIFVFSIQLTVKCSIYFFANDGIRTADLWNRKQPLYQLSHNHCPKDYLFYISFW